MNKTAKTAQNTIKSVLNTLSGKDSGLKAFLTDFTDRISAEDISALNPDDLSRIVKTHYELGKEQEAKKSPIIKIHTYKPKDSVQEYTEIDIVQNDTSFLLDSIIGEVVSHGLVIKRLIHPVLPPRNEAEGTKAKSHIHTQLDSVINEKDTRTLQDNIREIIKDVNYATSDWLKIRDLVKTALKELDKAKSLQQDKAGINTENINEFKNFMEYLYNNNFTFLGFCEYEYTRGNDAARHKKGSRLGILKNRKYAKEIDNIGTTKKTYAPPFLIAKINILSSVHRNVPMDTVRIKKFDNNGKATGEMLFIGLFTSSVYSNSITEIPYLRKKVANVISDTDFDKSSHNYREILHILQKYPRDELIQIDETLLKKYVHEILRLQKRPRTAMFTRTDPMGHYISFLVYVPKDRFDTKLRIEMQNILKEELGSKYSSFKTTIDDSPLARVSYIVDIKDPDSISKTLLEKIESKLVAASRTWEKKLRQELKNTGKNSKQTAIVIDRYKNAFSRTYTENYTARNAVYDIEKIEQALQNKQMSLDLFCPETGCVKNHMHLKIYNIGSPITLSDIIPVIENIGLKVISELPTTVCPANVGNGNEEDKKIWIHDFVMKSFNSDDTTHVYEIKENFEKTLMNIWDKKTDDDKLNHLTVSANMNWQEITILRTYVHYLKQIKYTYSTEHVIDAIISNPDVSSEIVALFKSLHDPRTQKSAKKSIKTHRKNIEKALVNVTSLSHDRILRSITRLVNKTLRTNYFQKDEHGKHKTYLSIKINSPEIDDIPQPRPFREIFVFSPRMEGIHLRGDKIARGGIRWSDRNEDFRTEILGLMKAQQVKNSIIVPMGAKGGFIVKNPHKEEGPAAIRKEGIECYKILIKGLLDITDNRTGDKITPPKDVVRLDGDDPYLVVAADKGTASFSDTANTISAEYDFWLGDAFASGGSTGYDHKKMGITAKGAWESVKRHFYELGHDTQKEDFSVIGVGDMAGDVFGNGMILSKHILLKGAFNHMHIFCDPNPDAMKSFNERKRLFKNALGWGEYNRDILSKGGRVFLRSEKKLELTPEIRQAFDIEEETLPPDHLIRAMLTSRTDLLWFGGIGTYIKASHESHEDAGDKANDMLRVDAKDIKAKVIGEGANLGITQPGRIEYAQNGGKINADFIDNSGGVDSSDHEVNIKILLNSVMNKKNRSLSPEQRNGLLKAMTSDIKQHVLNNNYQQAQAISLEELKSPENVSKHAEFIDYLEKTTGIDRKIENLPDRKEIKNRTRKEQGLTRPELGILVAYSKILLTKDLLAKDSFKDKSLQKILIDYFPAEIRQKYEKEILTHRLGNEIIATYLASNIVNRMGVTFAMECREKYGSTPLDIAKAFTITANIFELEKIWKEVESLGNKIPAEFQLETLHNISKISKRTITWFLSRPGRSPDIEKTTASFKNEINILKSGFEKLITKEQGKSIKHTTRKGMENGLPGTLSHDIALMPFLASTFDIIDMSMKRKTDISVIARIYFELGEHFHLDSMRKKAMLATTSNRWEADALNGVVEQLYACQAGLSVRILNDMKKEIDEIKNSPSKGIVKAWSQTHGIQSKLLDPIFTEMETDGKVDLPMLTIAEQRLRNLYRN